MKVPRKLSLNRRMKMNSRGVRERIRRRRGKGGEHGDDGDLQIANARVEIVQGDVLLLQGLAEVWEIGI